MVTYNTHEQALIKHKQGRGAVKNINISLLDEMSGNLLLVKAVAMAVFVKNRLRDPRIGGYTPNRLRDFIKQYGNPPHHTTVRKYVGELLRAGLVSMDDGDLLFCSLCNRRGKSNVSLGDTSALTIRELENELLVAQVVLIVKRKEYAKRAIEAAQNPRLARGAHEEFKKARQTCRKYGYGKEYRDYGLSYKGIARRLGIGLQKAEEVITYAVARGLLLKEKHQEQIYAYGIRGATKFFDEEDNLTFSTKNNAYRVFANTYSLPCYHTGNN